MLMDGETSGAGDDTGAGDGCADGAGGDTWWIGVAGTIFGCFVSNFGTNIQKVSLDRNSALPEQRQRSVLRQPLWLAGISCMVMGAIADFAALPFAPQSLLAPLATTTLVFNVAMANYLSKERPSLTNILATATILGVIPRRNPHHSLVPSDASQPIACAFRARSSSSCLAIAARRCTKARSSSSGSKPRGWSST